MKDSPGKNKKLKILAGLCAVTFFAQDLAWAAPELVSATRSAAAASSGGLAMPKVRFALPESVGSIDDHWQAPAQVAGPGADSNVRRDRRLVILIQDAHTNVSGQRSLARALERILPAESVRTVYTEGAEGDVSLRFLRDRVAPRTLDGVLMEYLKKGIVKGDDYWNAVSEHDFALEGIEDMDLYRESLEAYGRTVKLRAVVRPYLDRALRSALSLEERIYSPAMRRFEASRQSRRSGERSEADHAAFLLRAAREEGMDISKFRNVVLFEKYRTLESRLDADRLSREQREAFEALSEADRQELQPALDASVRSPMDTVYARAFGFALREKLGPSVSKYPELKKYFSYLSKVSRIRFASLLEEGRELEGALARRLVSTPDAATLHETVRSLEDLSDLVQLKITPEEFQRLERLRAFSDLRPLTGWINAKLAESGRNPELAVFLEREAFEAIRSARRFYGLTYERDRVMLERTIARMDEAGEERAVLIAGGFHAPGLKRRLREAGVSYVSVLPQVLHETDAERYEKLLLAQVRDSRAPSGIRVASAASRPAPGTSAVPVRGSADSARLGAPLLGPDAARLAAALGDPGLAATARERNRTGLEGSGSGNATAGARMATDRDLIGRRMSDETRISERLIEHIRLRMGVDDLAADQRLDDDPSGALERAFKAVERIWLEARAEDLDPTDLTQEEFNRRFGLMPVMLAAGLTTRFSAYIPKHLAQGGMDRTVISHALEGTYHSPGVKPVVYLGLKHLGLIVRDEYLTGYDAERHMFLVDSAITAFQGGNRAVRIDPKYIDPEKEKRYLGRSGSATLAFVRPLGHGDSVLQAITAVVPEDRYPYIQVAFGETANANLKTHSNASFISYLEIVGTGAEAVAGARKLKPEEQVSVKGNFFFNGDRDQLMVYTDFEQIPHARPTGRYDLVAHQTGVDLEKVKEELRTLPRDPALRSDAIRRIRSEHPYFAISDDGAIFDQEGLVEVVEDVRRWRDVPQERREWILKHFAVRENADRSSADFLIPSNTTTYRTGTILGLAGTVDRLRAEGGFDLDDVTDPRINLFWSVEPKDGAVKTLAWNYVRLASDRAMAEGRPIRARIAYVGERSPSSVKDPAALKKFVSTATASKNTGLAQAPELEDGERAGSNAVRARLVRGEYAEARLGLDQALFGPKGIQGFRNMVRALLADSSAQPWQGTLLKMIEDIQMPAPGAAEPGTGQGAHAPPMDMIVYGVLEQLLGEAVDAGWIGNNPHALVSDPVYAEAIARLRNRYAAELQRLRSKDLKIMSKSSRAEYLLDRLAETVGSGLASLDWGLAALSAFRERFDQEGEPHIPILAVVGSVDDGGSSESNKIAIERMGYGLIPAPGDQAHSMEGLMSEDKTRHLMGEGGRIESGLSLTDGVMPFIRSTVTDPGVTMREDFFLFAAAVMASAANVDRMNREAAATSREDEMPAQIAIRGASIRNIFLIGFLREAGLLTSISSLNRMRSAVKDPNGMYLYQRAMSEMARMAGVNGFEAAVSSFNPATLYAVYSGYTLMLRPASPSGDGGKLIPVVIEPDREKTIIIRSPYDPGRAVTLESHEETSLDELGLDFEGLVIGNRDGRIYLKVDAMPWNLDHELPDHPVMINPDGGLKYLALDGTGRDIEFQGTPERTPLFTAASGDVYLVPPVIKKQTFITEFPNHSKLLEVGLLDGYGISGRIRTEPVRQPANEPLLQNIRNAGPGDMIVIGPGSHFTSIIPHFLVDGFPEALRAAKERGADVIYVMNGVYDNETNRHSPEDLLAAIESAAGIPLDSMFTTVSGSAPESDQALAARSGIDIGVLRGVIHTPDAAELRSDATAASEAAKKGRALIYLREADQEAVRRRWPNMDLTAVPGSLRVKRVQKRKAGEYDHRVVHEADAIFQSVVLPAARGVRPGRLIAITGGSAVSALWADVSRKLIKLPSHSRDVRPELMKRIEETLGPGRFRIYPGGFASIDITPAGIDKSTAIKDLLNGGSDAVYFGDEFFDLGPKTGNDIPVMNAGSELKDKRITIFSVDKDPDKRTAEAKRQTIWIGAGPEATRRVLSRIREALRSGEKRLIIQGEGPDAERRTVLDLERVRASGSLVFDVDGTILGSKNDNFDNRPEIRGLFEDLLGAGLKLAIISGNSRSEQKKRVSDALSAAPGIERLTLYVNGGATRMRFDASGGSEVLNLSGGLSEADIEAVVGAVREAARGSLGLTPIELGAWKSWFGFDGTFGHREDFDGIKFRPFWASPAFEPDVVPADQMAGEPEDGMTVSMPFVEVRDGVQLSVKLLPKQVDLRPSASSAARMSVAAEPAPRLRRGTDVVVEAAAQPIDDEADPSGPVDHALNRLSEWFEANYGEPPVIETVFDRHSSRFWATSLSYDGHELMIRKSDRIWNDTTDTSDPVYHVMVDKDMEGYIAELKVELDAEGRVDAESTIKGIFIKASRKEAHPWAEILLKRWVRSMDGLTLDRSNPFFARHPTASVSFDTRHPGFPVYKPGTYDADRHGVRRMGSPVAETASLEAPLVSAGRKKLVFYGGLGAVVPRFYMEYLKRLALEYDVVYEAVDLLSVEAARRKIEAMELPYEAYHHASSFKIDPKDPPAGIVILTRPDSHFDITRWANEHGVPVFVEKPITLPGSVGAMRDHFGQHPDELFAIDFFFDNPSAREALKLIDAGKIGRIQAIRGEMIEENPIEKGREWLVIPEISGGGLGMDMLVHLTALAEMVLERWGKSLRHAELDPRKIVLARYEGAPPGTESYARIEGTVEKDVQIQFGAGKGLDRSAYYLVVEGELGEIEINLGTEHAKGFMEFRPKDGGGKVRIENPSSDIGYDGTTRKMVHSLHVPGEVTRREREFRMEATSLSVWLMNTAQVMNGPVYQTIPLRQDPAKVIAQDVGQATLSEREQEAIADIGRLVRSVQDHFGSAEPRVFLSDDRLTGRSGEHIVEADQFLYLLLDGKSLIELEPALRDRRVHGIILSPVMKVELGDLEEHIRRAVEDSGWKWGGFARPRSTEMPNTGKWIDVDWPDRLFDYLSNHPDPAFPAVTAEDGRKKSEMVGGIRLSEWSYRNASLPVKDYADKLVDWSLAIADAVTGLNQAGLSHGDIQPLNVVITPFNGDPSGRAVLIDWNDPYHQDPLAIRSLLGEGLWRRAKNFYFFHHQYSMDDPEVRQVTEIFGEDLVRLVVNRYASVAEYTLALKAYRDRSARSGARLASYAADAMRERGTGSARMAFRTETETGVYDLRLEQGGITIARGSRILARHFVTGSSNAGGEAAGPGLASRQVFDPSDAIRRKQSVDAAADRMAAGTLAGPGMISGDLEMSFRVPVEPLFDEVLDAVELRTAAQYLVGEILRVSGPSGAGYARKAVYFFDPRSIERLAASGRPGASDAVRTLKSAAERYPDLFVLGLPDTGRLVVNWIAGPDSARANEVLGGAAGEINVNIGRIRPGSLPSLRMGVAVPYAAVVGSVGAERWKEFFELEGPSDAFRALLTAFEGSWDADGGKASADLLKALQGKTPYRPDQRLKSVTFNIGARLAEVMRTLMSVARSA
jgi:predicted dehydrogenase